MIGNTIAGLFGIPTPPSFTVDFLVLAGGASGGTGTEAAASEHGGGGGAGGMRCSVTATGGGGTLESSLSLNNSISYSLTVGAGGASVTGATINGNAGNETTPE
jgi:hypothetical protein